MKLHRLGESARVAVIPANAAVHLYLGAGSQCFGINLANTPARALATELHKALPPGAPTTNRPKLPRYREQEPTDFPALVRRLRAGKATPRDADVIAHLLSYFGVTLA